MTQRLGDSNGGRGPGSGLGDQQRPPLASSPREAAAATSITDTDPGPGAAVALVDGGACRLPVPPPDWEDPRASSGGMVPALLSHAELSSSRHGEAAKGGDGAGGRAGAIFPPRLPASSRRAVPNSDEQLAALCLPPATAAAAGTLGREGCSRPRGEGCGAPERPLGATCPLLWALVTTSAQPRHPLGNRARSARTRGAGSSTRGAESPHASRAKRESHPRQRARPTSSSVGRYYCFIVNNNPPISAASGSLAPFPALAPFHRRVDNPFA